MMIDMQIRDIIRNKHTNMRGGYFSALGDGDVDFDFEFDWDKMKHNFLGRWASERIRGIHV